MYLQGSVGTFEPLLFAAPPPLPAFSVWEVVGVVFVSILALEILLYLTLYRRPRVNEALVRNGLGDVRVAINTGIIVLPVVHSIKRVNLSDHTLNFSFHGEYALRWQGGERYEGHALITVQVPAESPAMVLTAARNIENPGDVTYLFQLLEGIFRSTARDTLRTVKQLTFDIEPAAVEVRLTRSLDLAATAVGLRVRAVHLHAAGLRDTGRLQRALLKIDEPITLAADVPKVPPLSDSSPPSPSGRNA